MRFNLVMAALVMIGCRQSNPAPDSEAERVLADIRRNGADSIAARMSRDDAFGEHVLDAMGSGDSTWLEVAVALRPTGYADIAESLPISVAEALPKAPERVLSLIRRKEFSIDEVCTIPFIEPQASVVAAYYAKTSAALGGVKRADLAAERDQCAAALERAHGAAASKPAAVQLASHTRSTRILERHHIDMDGDGVRDDLIVWFSDSLDPGVIGSVELRLSRAGTKILRDVDRWDPPPADFKGTHNLVTSRLVYVADFPKAGRLLFLFGANASCCLQSLTIYQLGAAGPQQYFHADQFFFYESPNPGSSSLATMASKGVSEGMSPPTPDFVDAATYDPIIVYRLGERIRIDTAATIAANRKALGGFAGMKSRTDIRAVVHRDSSRALWDVRAGRIIP
jgi:hypothetical protein